MGIVRINASNILVKGLSTIAHNIDIKQNRTFGKHYKTGNETRCYGRVSVSFRINATDLFGYF